MLFEGVLMKKVLFFNFLFLAIAFITLEIFSFLLFVSVNFQEIKVSSAVQFREDWFNFRNFKLVENDFRFRPVEYKNSEKRPIVLFGCSHTYGTNLSEKETFSHQLSNYTGRTVYNFAIPGAGTSSMLYLLQRDEFEEEVPDSEYFIYVFVADHIRRNYTCLPNPIYNEFFAKYSLDRKNNLKRNKLSKLGYFFRSLYSYRLISNAYAQCKLNSFDTKLFEKLLQSSQNEISQKYKDAKFIVLVIDFSDGISQNVLSLKKEIDAFSEIEKNNNFKIIYSRDFKNGEDIMKEKYAGPDGVHPIKEFWTDIIPEFSQKADL